MASFFSQEDLSWKLNTEILPNVLITVGEYTFIVHKSHLASKCTYLRKLIEEYSNEANVLCAFTLDDFPGGARTFDVILKFFYGEKFELTSSNVVHVICAAYYLNMTHDHKSKKLIFQAEKLLSAKVLSNWNESIEALSSCEDVFNQADELGIVSRCLCSLAYKVTYHKSIYPDWWYEDVCYLNISLFKRLVQLLGAMGQDPVIISNAIAYYANEYNPGLDSQYTGIWSVEERKLLEDIVGMLPAQKGATSTKYLLSMLSTGILLNANARCIETLEIKIGAQLDASTLEDMLVPDFGDKQDAVFDFRRIWRIIENFVMENLLAIEVVYYSSEKKCLEETDLLLSKIEAVATIVDQYLAKVVVDSSVIPDGARPSHGGLFRAICAYVKYHPTMLEPQKQRLCQLFDKEKLSPDAVEDA